MTFLTAGFLFAGLAGAIPLVLHMINRQRAKDLPFSTLRFLRVSVQKTRRRKRIQDLFLMLLRMAVLLLVALGLARPTITNLSDFWGGGKSAVAVILDNSASMGVIDAGRQRFETARGAAHEILDELADGDQVALLLTGGPEFEAQGKLLRTQEDVLQMLDQAAVSYERADLALKLRDARKLLAQSDARNKLIYVISDLQALSWEGLKDDANGSPEGAAQQPPADPQGAKIPVIFVGCNRAPKPNVAVSGLDVRTAVPVAGVPVTATVELFNASAVPQKRHLELYVDGAKKAASPVLDLPPQGRLKQDFQFAFTSGGMHRGEVRLIGDDGSRYDDLRYFAMQVDQGIPVAIVKPRQHEIPYLEDSFYVEQALTPARSGGRALRTTVLTAAELASEPLSNYKVVFCVNLDAPQPGTATRLQNYVAAGGNLFWICGDNVDPEAYNRANEAAGGQLLPAPLAAVRAPAPGEERDSWHIAELDTTHPALAELATPASLYQSVLVYRQVTVEADSGGGAAVLARLDDGQPLLLQRSVERGTVTFLGTSAHVGWTNLPLRPIFLPLLTRMTFELAGAEQARYRALAGSPLTLPLEDEARSVTVEVRPPSGATLRLKSKAVEGQPGQKFTFADTHDVGIYSFRLLDSARPTQLAYSVNVDPDEADPTTISPEQLQQRLPGSELVFAQDPDDLSSTFRQLREGQSLWGLFLGAVLLMLVFETFVSNRLSPKLDEDELKDVAPGMRRLAKKGQAA